MDDLDKRSLLENEGFVYHPRRMIFINNETRKVFSQEFVSDNPKSWIIEKI